MLNVLLHRYIVTEFCRGTLADYICGSYEGPRFINDRDILVQITKGIVHLHGKNIIHRDLKPNNILIHVPDGSAAGGLTEPVKPQIKLADFDISKLLENDERDFTNTSITNPSGSRGWMSPEWYQSRRCDGKVDIWAAGCLFLYTLSGGKHPFGEDVDMRKNLIIQGRIALRLIDLKYPYLNDNATYQFIKSMLDTDPNKRPKILLVLARLYGAKLERVLPFDLVIKVEKAAMLHVTCRALSAFS